MGAIKIIVLVHQNEGLIKKLCTYGFRKKFEIGGNDRPKTIKRIREEDLMTTINKYGGFRSKEIIFQKDSFLDMDFSRFINPVYEGEIVFDAENEAELNQAMKSIKQMAEA